MFIGKSHELSRRAFMRRTSQLAVAGAASSYALGLAGMGEAAAFSSAGGYKALVCVFLYGGNDHANTVIPYDATNYGRYQAIRGTPGGGGIALPRASLAGTVLNPAGGQTLTDDMTLALAPTMPKMAQRFGQGRMAPLLNVGPLIVPLTKAQYDSNSNASYPRPPKLFSHNDQQSTWQSSQPEGSTTGWGGRMGDLAQSGNTNAMFTAINASGNAVFLSGENAVPYQLAGSGAVTMKSLTNRVYGASDLGDTVRQLTTTHHGHVLQADYATTTARSVTYAGFVNDALATANLSTDFGSGNSLASQLNLVARLIAARGSLGVKRQVFLVGMGGFDHHDGLIGSHEALLGKVDSAMDAFYRATVEMGVSEQVTTFTASDFGRTLASNGDGSDHGWGSHHFVMGGAVNGGRFYGRAPEISVEGNDQVGRGRLLPTVSVDEYSATLAKWFGVSGSEMPSIAPNIGRFASPDLGFMKNAV
ncbi:DUF1501 domain-containing protein [Aurantiacibacter gangjinensis]|uniref:Tat pathway signal protein n=1 Tax=Aurantiacibacter gangjinensis TaxID=502682 RepID=A0A0G9MMZ6_9SPHN|nr:DUF1501 domain-containing protein [Aurantiacibacter gangjinensis]APE28174.1 protein of unknown function DUF1501 [Aurantiacibacter gangjinensis]KLE32082.1 Tat pathway signal protein [Aurantiacibacter gangjinensis]